VMSLSVLRHVDVSNEDRAAYLKVANAKRRANGDEEPETAAEPQEAVAEVALSDARIAELEQAEEFLLTVTDGGFGKRSSAYEYRVTGRGGQGIANIMLSRRSGRSVAATFPVQPGDDVMLVTDAGRLIRVPADQVRITGRQAMGVMLLRLDEGERVTAVFPVIEQADDTPEANEDNQTPGGGPPAGASEAEDATDD